MAAICRSQITTRSGYLAYLLPVFIPDNVLAHGFAQRYELPVPLNYYLAGAAATVFLSFMLIAWFLRRGRAGIKYPSINLLTTLPDRTGRSDSGLCCRIFR